jgi:hypothetical protein
MAGNRCYFPEEQGEIVEFYPADPLFANEISFVFPGGPPGDMQYSYQLLNVSFFLTVAIAGVGRYPAVCILNNAAMLVSQSWPRAAQPTGSTMHWCWSPSYGVQTGYSGIAFDVWLPTEFWLQTGWRLTTQTLNFGNDQFFDTFIQCRKYRNNTY